MRGINKFINNYLKEDTYNNAILINGKWGIGKTYVVKEIIDKTIKDKCIYISLYKIKDIETLENKIYDELFIKSDEKSIITQINKNDSWLLKLGKDIGKGLVQEHLKINIDTSMQYLKELHRQSVDFSKFIFVLDDLERTSCNISEMLGYISDLLEQKKSKVIIVANEDEIINGEYKDVYLKTKEKTISETYNFEPDVKIIFKEFLNNKSINDEDIDRYKNFKVFLQNDKYDFIYRWDSNKCNLRTIKYFIAKAWDIFKCTENIEGLEFNSYDEEKDVYNQIFVELFERIKSQKEPEEKNADDDTELSGIYQSIMFENFESIEDYMRYKSIDEDKFKVEIDKYIKQKDFPLCDDGALSKIHNEWFELEDNELNSLIDVVVKTLGENKYSPNQFIRILYWLNKLSILGFKIDIEIVISNMKSKLKEEKNELITDFSIKQSINHEELDIRSELRENIEKQIKELNREIEKRNFEIQKSKYEDLEDAEKWFEKSKSEVKDLFEIISPNKLVELLVKADNKQLYNFRTDYLTMKNTNRSNLVNTIELLKEVDVKQFGIMKQRIWRWIINDFNTDI